MTAVDDRPQVHRLYSDYIENPTPRHLATKLYEEIPQTMGEAYRLLAKIRERYGAAPEGVEGLKKAMKSHLRAMGLLTSKVAQNIDRLDVGVVETGQQPMALGGPSLILNKIAYSRSLCDLGEEGYVPLFYVADYDGVQAELLNIRVPSPSARGLLITYPAGPEYEDAPIYMLPNPDEDWLRETIEKIWGNYRGMLRGSGQATQETALQNLAHALTVLKTAYYSTGNVSDWSTRVLGTLINIEADLGVPILMASTPEVRPFFQDGYEQLLAEPHRTNFIQASNRAVELIEAAGYRPQIGLREPDYVPFYLECSTPGCHRRRVELKYTRKEGSQTAHVRGKCPRCGETYEYSFNARSPDLSEIVDRVTPRVDSRQMVVDSAIPVLAHVGGPGEASYYAEVIPAAVAIGIPFPTFLRYTRTFYNTPWNETLAKGLQEKSLPTMLERELFDSLSRWVEARNNDDLEELRKAHRGIRESIEGSYDRLLSRVTDLNSEIDAIKMKLRDPKDRDILIREMREKQSVAQGIENYISSAYGRFSSERFGPEVSWSWLDLAMVSGLRDLMGVYMREYHENTPTSSMFFVNL